jgi:ATP-binding cassette subfamily B protein
MSSEGRKMPQPKGRMMTGMAKGLKLDKATFKKLMKRITSKHKIGWIAVIVLIIISVVASIQSSLFIGTLIDDYIAPLLLEDVPVFDGLFKAFAIYVSEAA